MPEQGSLGKAPIALEDIRWHFLSAAGKDFLSRMANDTLEGELVKRTPKRQVLRFEKVYLKEVAYKGFSAVLKAVSEGSACKEGRISLGLSERGVAVPEILGYGGEYRKGILKRDVLLTGEVVGGHIFHEVMKRDYPSFGFSTRTRLMKDFASFVRRLHDAGASHSDLHIGNVLVLEQGDGFGFILLDNDRVRLRPESLSPKQKIGNLAIILSNLRFHITRTQYLRFLKEYGLPSGEEGRRFLATLEHKTFEHSRKISEGKTRQCLFSNRRFSREHRQGFTVHRRRGETSTALLNALLPDPDEILEKGQILKAGRTVRAARITVSGQDYFLKRYNCKGAVYRLRNAFRRSRAVRAWTSYWGFRLRGIPVPEPIACLEERHWRLLGRSYLLTAFVDEAVSLTAYWEGLGAERRKDLLARLGYLLGRMHRFGCLHGDLKWNNILVSQNRTLFLTDLDGSRFTRVLRDRRVRRDMSRFLRDLLNREHGAENKDVFVASWRRWSSGFCPKREKF